MKPPPRPPVLRTALDDRRRVVAAVGLTLSLWGFFLVLGGLILRSRSAPRPPSPMGNGTPPLLLVGGGAAVALGLGLWACTSGGAVLRSRLGLKLLQVIAFVVALATLVAGILTRSPKRDPIVVALAALALAVSVAARWAENRRFRPAAPSGHD